MIKPLKFVICYDTPTIYSHQMWATASHLKNPDIHRRIYASEPYLHCLSRRWAPGYL